MSTEKKKQVWCGDTSVEEMTPNATKRRSSSSEGGIWSPVSTSIHISDITTHRWSKISRRLHGGGFLPLTCNPPMNSHSPSPVFLPFTQRVYLPYCYFKYQQKPRICTPVQKNGHSNVRKQPLRREFDSNRTFLLQSSELTVNWGRFWMIRFSLLSFICV